MLSHVWASDSTCPLLQAQQKKAGGLPDPNKREGPVKTAQDIYEEGGVKVCNTYLKLHFCIVPSTTNGGSAHYRVTPVHCFYVLSTTLSGCPAAFLFMPLSLPVSCNDVTHDLCQNITKRLSAWV